MLEQIDRATALIIGANGGIGLGFVKALMTQANFTKIYGTYRERFAPCSRDRANSAELLTLSRQNPDKLVCFNLDITDEAQIADAVKQISAEVDTLNLVVYCVGMLHQGNIQPEKSLKQIVSENLLDYFQINSIGAVLLAKHLMPLYRKNRDKSIFACISAKVGSIGDNRLGGWYGYRASKAALNMFIKTIAIEYSRRCPKTIVVALHPGTTDTRLSKPFQKNVPPEKLFSVEYTVDRLMAVLANLEMEDSGEFFSWDGSRLPW
jgi:NAD(P)-dependent dehydrogenase (short-subunit alcohol dehydrogenase family)